MSNHLAAGLSHIRKFAAFWPQREKRAVAAAQTDYESFPGVRLGHKPVSATDALEIREKFWLALRQSAESSDFKGSYAEKLGRD
jgi:hypothetical protein